MELYIIRNKLTGLYSSGGINPKWQRKPKIWQSVGHVKSHLTQFRKKGFSSLSLDQRSAYLQESEILKLKLSFSQWCEKVSFDSTILS